MQHALRVRVVDGLGDPAAVFSRALCRERAIVHDVSERSSLHVIHREKVVPIALARLVNANDVRML